MKTLKRLLFAVLLTATPVALVTCTTACSTTAQTAEVKTLLTVGLTAQTAMDTTAALLKSGQITVTQYQTVANFYDNVFQPAFAVAKNAQALTSTTPAPANLLALIDQLASLVASLTASKS